MPVHPRLRGEHDAHMPHRTSVYGSSPPTRGTQEERKKVDKQWRFIPAYAGNTGRNGAWPC